MPVRPAATPPPVLPAPPAVRALLALLLPLAVLLAGCAAPAGPAPGAVVLPKYYDPRPLLADVDARMRTDGGALLSAAGSLTGAAGAVPVTVEGALRFDPGRPGGEPAVRLTLRTAGASTALVRTGGRTWVRPPGAGWLEAGRDPMPAGTGAMVAVNVAAAADPLADPTRYADAVLVADAVDERVDGVPTVRYTLVVDLGRAVTAEADPVRRAALRDQQRAGTTRLAGEVWLDAERHPVQGRIRRSLPGAGTLDLLVRYRDWGSPVTVDPPVPG